MDFRENAVERLVLPFLCSYLKALKRYRCFTIQNNKRAATPLQVEYIIQTIQRMTELIATAVGVVLYRNFLRQEGN